MASYGLYTHIQSNKRRSIALIVGLFFLVYVMTYAGALLAEALTGYDAPIELLLRRAWIDLLYAAPWATLGTVLWIAVVIAGVLSFFVELVFRLVFQTGFSWRRTDRSSRGESKGGGGGVAIAIVIALVLIAVAWLLSIVIRFALSRKREFLADAGSVELTKNPDAMISALRKIEGRGELQGATSAVMEMCVDNPREGIADLSATHPSVDSRVGAT